MQRSRTAAAALMAVASSAGARRIARAAVGLGILILLAMNLGAEPFLRGLEAVSPTTIGIAAALTAVATICATWRWRGVARRLGVPLAWRDAVAAYYRSQFVNSVVPGGIVGDVDRAIGHGRSAGAIGQASRAVAAERVGGQTVQIAFAIAVLTLIGMWGYASIAEALGIAVAVAALVVALATALSARFRGALRREAALLRAALGGAADIAGFAAASILVVTCHALVFVVACAAVGVTASAAQLVSVSLLTVLAGSVPLGIGGWGPRETVAAWAFGLAGLSGADGIAASTAFGVVATIAVLPGAAVLVASVRMRPSAAPAAPAHREETRV